MAATLHIAGIQFRITGAGNLIPVYYAQDDAFSKTLVSMPMSTGTANEPFRLGSFVTEKVRLKVSVTEIDEYFRINKIVIYAKPIYKAKPNVA